MILRSSSSKRSELAEPILKHRDRRIERGVREGT
jgi:hypothetical protein